MKRRDTTTRLPLELREKIAQNTGSNKKYGGSGKNISRKQIRKAEKLEKKQRRAEYLSYGATSFKRRATNELEGAPPKKKLKRESGHQEAMNENKGTQKASAKLPKESEMAPELARTSKPRTALERLANRQAKVVEPVQSQAVTDEHREIAWLQYKLGIKGKVSKSSIFKEDGLDDLLDGLDGLVHGESPSDAIGMKDAEEEASDSADEEDKADHEYPEDEEWAGISKGGKEHEDGSEHSDNTVQKLVRLVDSSPEKAMSAGKYVPPHLRQRKNEGDEAKTRLSRQLKGLVNRLSDQNIAIIVSEIDGLYRDNKRNDVTTILTTTIISSIADHSSLLDHHVVLHAALVAALYRTVGVEFAAYCVQEAVSLYLSFYQTAQFPDRSRDDEEIKGKECTNLMVLLCELYNLQVIACILMYDMIRALLGSVVSEMDVEILLKILRTSGSQLRQDDPLALRDIVLLVDDRVADRQAPMSSRTKFMLEALTDLKNNKVRKTAGGSGPAGILERIKKFLSGLGRAQHLLPHEPLRVTLEDLQSSETRGKWWLVGAAWAGDPLVDEKRKKQGVLQVAHEMVDERSQVLLKLARKQGMNTDIRRSIFIVLMSSEDYVDACERLSQLNLTEVQQREIVKVLLHCCGSEKTYNPYYTMIAQHLCQQSHSHKVTLQFCLWDLLREMGEHDVGGVEMLKLRGEQVSFDAKGVSETRRRNIAKAYAWWLAKGTLSLAILKPVEFSTIKADTRQFFELLLRELFVDTQTDTPDMGKDALGAIWEMEKRDRSALEAVMIKGTKILAVAQGLLVLFGAVRRAAEDDSAEKRFVQWALGVSTETLRTGMDLAGGL